MRVALTGATGRVGRFIVPALFARGHAVTALARNPVPGTAFQRWSLGETPDLAGHDALVHCAFSHVPGRYRGGEGSDPEGFLAANLDGTRRLFDAAAAAGVSKVIFLSSRAVFDGYPAGTALTEALEVRPNSLYGEAKVRAENHLFDLPLTGLSLRATGVYGPGPGNKWQGLFADYLAGRTVAPRCGTEVHGVDLAAGVNLLLENEGPTGPVHASNLVLDRHDLLSEVQALTGCPHPPPERADTPVSRLRCDRLDALGWRPGGRDRLRADLPKILG